MTKRSQSVDAAIRKSWAKIAKAAFEKAISKLGYDHPVEAEAYMLCMERWLDKAGAKATDWYF